MRLKSVSRRKFLSDATLMTLAACLAGCTKTVTKYRPDGTPYTVKENDPVASLAGVVLLLLLLAAAASSKSNKSSMNHQEDGQDPRDEEGKVHLASATSTHRPAEDMGQEVSIADSKGRLLASVDSFERVEHHDLATAKRLLASAKVFSLGRPITIRLRQETPASYRIEDVHILGKPPCEKSKVLRRRIKGKLYEVRVHTNTDGNVRIEMVLESHSKQGVA
jgi:hypothetical protein